MPVSTRLTLVALASALIAPSVAVAQGSITGVVRDSSGGVLPGVSVEAASAVLIEKVRSVVSDGTGQYRIVDLRPGTYSVTFLLSGFRAVRREGIELTGSFTATVNAELRVGALEETVTVTGDSPIVDVQTALRQRVMDKEVLDAVPAGRDHRMLAVLIPGVTSGVQDVGGQNTLRLGTVAIHGGRTGDQRLMVDGMTIRNTAGSGALTNFMPDMGSTQEVTVDYGAGSVETMTGGVNFNYIPREGGNRFTASVFATGANRSFQSSNFTQELADRGLRVPNALHSLLDINPSAGGPIMRDKLWFYSSARWQTNKNYVAGIWDNLNAGDPTKWTYEPDLSRQGVFAIEHASLNTRLTWQASPKHKFNVSHEHQTRDYVNTESGVSPESGDYWIFPRLGNSNASWTAPLTSRLLLEVRAARRFEDIRNVFPPAGDVYRTLILVNEQGGSIPGLRYRGKGNARTTAVGTFSDVMTPLNEAKVSLSYVTGAHAFKVGLTNLWGEQSGNAYDIDSATSYRFRDGVPNQIEQRQTTYQGLTGGVRAELGVYAQDKWTLKRLTLNSGVRFDYFHSGFRDLHLGPTVFSPNRNLTFPGTSWYRFKDVSPRFGAAYDLFGNGKTAIKMALGQYALAIFPGDGNPISGRIPSRVTRSWNDANRDYVPDCDLLNPLSNGECGTISDLNFGVPAALSTTYDDATLGGWGRRPHNWEFSTGVQHEVMPRVGVEVAYFRRWYGNFTVTDNLAVTTTDFSPFSVTAPIDARLPEGGGYVVGGLYNLNQDKVGQVDNYVTLADNYGKQREHWNGVDVTVNARVQEGILLQGGMSTGRTTTDNCEIRAALPEISATNPYCRVEGAFIAQYKLLGTYTLPTVDVQIAGTFQSLPGPASLANVVFSSAQVQPSLGRPLSGGAANATVNVVEPNTIYGERLNQLNLRFSKLLRLGGTRARASLDIYNVFNGNYVRSWNNNFAAWQRPTAILDARLFRISAQFDF